MKLTPLRLSKSLILVAAVVAAWCVAYPQIMRNVRLPSRSKSEVEAGEQDNSGSPQPRGGGTASAPKTGVSDGSDRLGQTSRNPISDSRGGETKSPSTSLSSPSGRSSQEWLQRLETGDEEMRHEAAIALCRLEIGSNATGNSIPTLLRGFKSDPSTIVRRAILGSLLRWSSDDAFSALLASLYDESDEAFLDLEFLEIGHLVED